MSDVSGVFDSYTKWGSIEFINKVKASTYIVKELIARGSGIDAQTKKVGLYIRWAGIVHVFSCDRVIRLLVKSHREYPLTTYH